MALEPKHQQVLLIGALIGAVLGAGVAYLLMIAPSEEEDEESKSITARDLLGLTGTAAALIRKVDDVRRKV